MWRFKLFTGVLFGLTMTMSCYAGIPLTTRADKYVLTYEEDALSEQWAVYLHTHLLKRVTDKTIVELRSGGKLSEVPFGSKSIHFEVAPDLKGDYCISHTPERLHLRVRNREVALWMIYQLIEVIGTHDSRFAVADLPPAWIEFSDQCKFFDFAYREPFFAPNLTPEYAPLIGTHNLELDWGLWGHNLSNIVKKVDNESVFALSGGKRTRSQLSFSSSELYHRVSQYILENYGQGDKHTCRFMIMPSDNDIVCTCPACAALGNTSENATPAVVNLMKKLAGRFPEHQFFTSAYRTTSLPPETPLPSNAGVFFSTIDLVKGVEPNLKKKNVQQFIRNMEAWKVKTPNLYLWDYAANFDDYLTPIPTLLSEQKQFAFFKSIGVKGIFLNASGYDYMPFDDVKTYVSGVLMMDVNANVDTLCRSFLKKQYPVSHDLLADYYLSLEHGYFNKQRAYDMYGGMVSNMNTYLDAGSFVRFYDALKQILPTTREEEKKKLTKLFTALSFTRLQVAYVQGSGEWGYADRKGNTLEVKPSIREIMDALANWTLFPNLRNYKESDGSIQEYLAEWERLIQQPAMENKLLNVPLKILSKPDEGFETGAILHDGIQGFRMDYHQGWYLCSGDDLCVSFPVSGCSDARQIKLRFLVLPKHRMFPPSRIEIYADGHLAGTATPKTVPGDSSLSECLIPARFAGVKEIQLKMIRKQAQKSILACDEIQVLN